MWDQKRNTLFTVLVNEYKKGSDLLAYIIQSNIEVISTPVLILLLLVLTTFTTYTFATD